MPTPSYRDVARPALIDTNIPSSGGAEAAQSLAASFKQFERTGAEVLGGLRAEQGRREGAEAGRTDHPAFRTGIKSLTAYGRAYNDAATRSYAIQSEAAADEAATRLEAEAGNDPQVFKSTFGARRDATLKEAPPEAREILAEVYDRRMAEGVSRLVGAQSVEIKKDQRAFLAEGVTRATDRIGQWMASDNPRDHELADEEQIKQNMMIDAAVRDGTLSRTEGSALKVDASRAVTEQTVTYRFRNEMDNPYGDPVAFIERLKEANKTSEAMPPQDEEKLVAGLLNELQEKNALAAAGRHAESAAQKARWDLGDNHATNAMISGNLTANKLTAMLKDDEIDPAVARTLYNDLKAGNDRPDDAQERFSVETTLLEHTEDEIGKNAKLSWQTRRELVDKRRQLATTWRGTQQAKEGAERIDRALRILPGTPMAMLDKDTARQRENALTSFYNKVDALKPAERQGKVIEVAEEVADTFIRGNKTRKLETLRGNLQKIKDRAGPVDQMDEEYRKAFDTDIARREADIKALEQQVK